MNEQELSKLYKALISKGYSTDDLGDEQRFASKMSDAANRKQLYDWVSSRGDFRIGDYDSYEQRLSGSTQPEAQPEQTEETPSESPAVEAPAVSAPAQNVQSASVQQPAEQQDNASFQPIGGNIGEYVQQGKQPESNAQPEEKPKPKQSKPLLSPQEEAKLASTLAGTKKVDYAKQFGDNMAKIRKSGSTFNGNTTNRFNPQTGKWEVKYVTKSGKAVDNIYDKTTEDMARQDAIDATTEEGKKRLAQRVYNDYENRVSSAVEKIDPDNTAELVWNEAEARTQKEITDRLAEQGRNGLLGALAAASPSSAMNVTLESYISHLKYHDLQRMADDAWNRLGKDKQKELEDEMYMALSEVSDKGDEWLRKTAKQLARQESDRRMFELAVEKNAPSSATELFFRKALMDNSMGKLFQAAARAGAGTLGDTEARDVAEQRYEDSGHRVAGIAGTVAGFAIDPMMALSAGVGGAATKGVLWTAGKVASETAAKKFASGLAGRMILGSVGGAGTFTSFEAGGDIVGQLRLGGKNKPDEETGRYNIGDYSASSVGESALHGAIMGATTGVIAPYLGNVSSKLAQATKSTAGKLGVRVGELGVSTMAEGTIFASPEIYKTINDYSAAIDSLSDENSPNYIANEAEREKKIEALRNRRNEQVLDVWTQNMAMMAGFKVQGLLKSAPERINELRAEGRTKGGFETRLRKILDGNPSLALTKEEKEELEQGGYGDLSELTEAYKQYKDAKQRENEPVNVVSPDRMIGTDAESQLPYQRFIDLVKDSSISEAARAKMYYYLTGNALPMSTVMGSTITENTDADGNVSNYVVESVGANGVITRRVFDTKERADVEVERINRQAELNSIDMGEKYYNAKCVNSAMYDACETVSKECGAPARQLFEMMKLKPEQMSQVEKQWAERIINVFTESGDKLGYWKGGEDGVLVSNDAGLRKSIDEKYGVDVDKAIKKEPNRRSEQEQKAIEEYTKELYKGTEKEETQGKGTPDPTSPSGTAGLLEDKGIKEPEKQLSESYDNGYQAWSPQEKQDIALEYAYAGLTNKTEEERQAAWDGLVKHINEQADYLVAQLREWQKELQHVDGSYHPATLKEKDADGNNKSVYIVDGDDNSVMIAVYDPIEGKKKIVSANDIFEKGRVITAEEDEKATEDYKQKYIQDQLDEATGKLRVVEGEPFSLPTGEKGVVVGQEGDNVILQLEDGTQVPVPLTDLQSAADALAVEDYRQRHGIVEEQEQQPEEVAAAEPETFEMQDEEGNVHQVTVIGDDEANGDNVIVSMDGGEPESVSRDMLEQLRSSIQETQTEGEAGGEASLETTGANEPSAAPAADAMPMVGEEPDFMAVSPERGHRYLFEESGLDREEANQFVEANKKAADKAFEKAQNARPKMGTSLAKYNKEKAEWQARVDAAQAAADYWNAVSNVQKAAEEAEKQAAFAEQTAEPLDRQMILDEQKTPAAKIEKAKQMYGDYFDSDFTVPYDASELVALNMPKEKISWEGREGVRGLQQELGSNHIRSVGKGSTTGFNTFLAKKGEGISTDKAIHDIWESPMNQLPNGEKRWDTEEIRAAFIDMFRNAEKPSDIRDYVYNNRARLAEQMRAAEDEAAANESIAPNTAGGISREGWNGHEVGDTYTWASDNGEPMKVEIVGFDRTNGETPEVLVRVSDKDGNLVGSESVPPLVFEEELKYQQGLKERADRMADLQQRFENAETSAEKAAVVEEAIAEISDGEKFEVFTNDTLIETLRNVGANDETIAYAEKQLAENKKINGFYGGGTVFINADAIGSIDEVRSKYVHERQHKKNTEPKNFVYLQAVKDAATRDDLAGIVRAMSGTDAYDEETADVLADEFIAFGTEVAYRVSTTEALEAELAVYGAGDRLIEIIKEIDNEQRKEESLSKARRNVLLDWGRNAGRNRQDERDSQARPERGLERQGDGTPASSTRGTGEVAEAERLEKAGINTDLSRGDARFSVHDLLGKDEQKQVVADLMKVTGRSEKVVKKWLQAEQSLAKVILEDDNVAFLDIQADESVPSIWKNSDYPQGTVEFSNICRKRLPLTMLYQRLQQEFPDRVFSASELETIRRVMKENGQEVACGLCFVEDRRQLLGEIGQSFIDVLRGRKSENTKLTDKENENQNKAIARLKESGDKYIPNLYELLTLDGMKRLRKAHPAVANAFVEYNAARGMQAGRLFNAYSAYHRDILKFSPSKVKSINDNGGLRIFSFSDFEAHHLIDLVQVITDCASKGIKIQGYTKVPEFAQAVKDTGVKLNRSLIAKSKGLVDADYVPQEGEAVSPNVINGKCLLFDTIEGIDVNSPYFFDSTDNPNVGNIIVGISDEHIQHAMLDPYVDYIIPFHSGLSESIRKQKGIGDWVNYKNTQVEKVEDESGKLKNAPKHGINIYTDVLGRAEELIGKPITTAKEFQLAFFKACEEKGFVPRFAQFIKKTKGGNYAYTKGYEKLLLDFKLFDKNGKIVPQEAVKPIFDSEFLTQILNDYVKGEKEQTTDESIYDKVKERLGLKPSFSIQGLEGYTEKDIEDIVKEHVREQIENVSMDADIVGVKVIGSRINGNADENSDLDVLVEYKGTEREDDFFNVLADEPLTINGINVDINPITKGKSGTIDEWLKRNSGYRKETDKQPSFSITAEQEQAYDKAVAEGDMDTAQRMVDEKLEKEGYTIRGEHGTTHMFTIFDYRNSNPENSFGRGHYFTSDRYDAEQNYASDEGADLTNRIELKAEQLEWADGYEYMSYEERMEAAKEMLNGGENRIISAKLRMENPAIFGTDPYGKYQETFFDFDEDYNEEYDEYGEPEGLLVDFVDALSQELWNGDYIDADNVDVNSIMYDGGGYTADQLKKKCDELLQYVQDEDGNIVSSEIFSKALQRMGFDGIIDNAPSLRFRNMGLGRGTKHYIVFDSKQIKQADAVTYDDNGNVIPLSQRGNKSNPDIRFAITDEKRDNINANNGGKVLSERQNSLSLQKNRIKNEKESREKQLERLAGGSDATKEILSSSYDAGSYSPTEAEQRTDRGEKRPIFGQIVQRAKENGSYIEDISPLVSGRISKGQENIVYLSSDGRSVIKVNNLDFYKNEPDGFDRFVNRLLTHNLLFPKDAYIVLGFSSDGEGNIRVILSQPYVKGRQATSAEIDEFLEGAGFETDITDDWFDGRFVIGDTKEANAMIDEDGEFRAIDFTVKEEPVYSKEEQEESYFDGQPRFSIVQDEKLKNELESGDKVKVYRAMQLVDGKLYPPMAGKVNGEWQNPIQLGVWEQADEHPELVRKDGKFKLDKGNGDYIWAAYNPYLHTSRSPLNDQFASAWKRPELVTVEVEVPASELTSGYKAEKAKDSVGETDWKSGSVSGKLAKKGNPRKVILSRYDKPIRIVPNEEVAQRIAEMLDGTGLEIPFNTVTPELREALIAQGVKIGKPERGNAGKASLVAYKAFNDNNAKFSIASTFNDKGVSIDDKNLLDEYGLSHVTLSKKGDVVTLTHFIAKDKGQGNGTRFMEDLIEEADKNGWTLALTPDASFGATSVGRLKDFYKRFGFKDNKGRSTDFTISESMVRKPNGDARFSIAGQPKPTFYSNAARAVENIKQEKATPEQWLKMIEKNGGLKAGEDKWMGLSDWLKEQQEAGIKTITKDSVLSYIRVNQIVVEDVEYTEAGLENSERLKELKAEFDEFFNQPMQGLPRDRAKWAFDQMVEKYGDDFRNAFYTPMRRDGTYRLEPEMDWNDNLTDEAKYFLGVENSIENVRKDYTTSGLNNKKEIALVVPTIESWNESDKIHFGDAGEGRAVAWIRFGDAEAERKIDAITQQRMDDATAARHSFGRSMRDKYGMGYTIEDLTEEEKNEYQRLYQEWLAAAEELHKLNEPERVLVIDEIQSKRHQEGREKGYKPKDYNKLRSEIEAYRAMPRLTEEDFDRYMELSRSLSNATDESIPDAPFEKNWHELAMKRMLRYAAENGYDKIAWTKGEQQAERYSLVNVVDKLDVEQMENGNYNVYGHRVDAISKDLEAFGEDLTEKELAEIVGKEIAKKAIEGGGVNLKGEELRIGGEGMKGFYDYMLPKFMDKYGKKWGVKTGEIELPSVEEAGRHMWSVDVTPEMKESVMQGQPMFSISGEDIDTGKKTFAEIATEKIAQMANENKNNLDARVNAMRLIGGNLAKLRSAMSMQREYDRSTVNAIVRQAKMLMDTLGLDDLTRGEVKKLTGLIAGAAGKEDITKSATSVLDMMIGHQLRELDNILKKQLSIRGTKLSGSGVEVQGRLDIEGVRMVNAMKDGMKLSEDGLAGMIADCEDRMDDDDAVVSGNAAVEYQGLMLAKQYLDDIKKGEEDEIRLRNELKNTKSAEFENRNSYREYVESVEQAIRDSRMERMEKYYDLLSKVGSGLAESIERAKDWREAEQQRVNEIRHNANSDMEGREMKGHQKDTAIDNLANSPVTRAILMPLMNLDQMLRMFGRKNPDGKGYLWERYMYGWQGAIDGEYVMRERYLDKLNEGAKNIFGEKYKYGNIEDYADTKDGMVISYFDGAQKREYPLPQSRMMYLYAVEKMPMGKATNRHMGFTEENMAQIEANLDPKLKEFVDWVQGTLLPEMGAECNEVHKRMFGADMADIRDYFPFVRDRKALKLDVENGAQRQSDKITTITGAIKKRTVSTAVWDLPNCNFMDVLTRHIQEMCHWKNFAELNRDFGTLLSYNHFKQQVMGIHSIYGAGENLWNNFTKVCAMATDAYDPKTSDYDKYASQIAKGVTMGKVAARPFTAIKQVLSQPAFWGDADPIYMLEDLATLGLLPAFKRTDGDEGRENCFMWAWRNMPNFRKRVKSRTFGDFYLRDTEYNDETWISKIQDKTKWGMLPNIGVDAWTVALGSHAVYKTNKAKYLRWGMDEEQAEATAIKDAELCFNKSQQSSEGAFLAPMQVDHTIAASTAMVFRNSSTSYTREFAASARNLKRLVSGDVKTEDLAKQILRKLGKEEWSDAEWQHAMNMAKNEKRQAVLRNAVNNVVFGWVLPLLWRVGGMLPVLLLSNDKEDKWKRIEDAAKQSSFAPVEGLLYGDVQSDVYNKLAGFDDKDWKYIGRSNPLISDVQRVKDEIDYDPLEATTDVAGILFGVVTGVNPQTVVDWATAIVDTCKGDKALANEGALLAARLLNCPPSQLKQLYFEELDMTGEEASKYTPEELIDRWAKYKVRNAHMMLSDSTLVEKEKKRAEKYILDREKERMADKDNETLIDVSRNGNDIQKKAATKEMENRIKDADYLTRGKIFDESYGSPVHTSVKREIAKSLGGKDPYTYKSDKYVLYRKYRNHLDYVYDVALYVDWQKAKKAKDEDLADEIKFYRDDIAEWMEDLTGVLEADEVTMERIREARKNAFEKIEEFKRKRSQD